MVLTRKAKMKSKLVAISLCALFALALVTVRIKSREILLRYEIAELEKYELLLHERFIFLKSEVERKAGVVGLLNKAIERGILLHLDSTNGRAIPLLTPLGEGATLE
jgi:hypothetical protein